MAHTEECPWDNCDEKLVATTNEMLLLKLKVHLKSAHDYTENTTQAPAGHTNQRVEWGQLPIISGGISSMTVQDCSLGRTIHSDQWISVPGSWTHSPRSN